jgi:hypothetical protein
MFAAMKKALCTAFAALTTFAVAETPPAPPARINLDGLPGGASVVQDVVVPVPSEIFGVLDKVGRPRWQEILRPTKNVATPGDREQLALLLGTVIAEGFIAVEAEKEEEVKSIGKVVIQLADALNVGKSVKKRASAIIDAADKKDWKSVRQELDKAQRDVQSAMREMNDENYAQLVSLGGWLRGLEALSTDVKNEYKKDNADLLHQPGLIDHFNRRLNETPKKIKDKPLVKKMQKGLTDIKPLMGTEGVAISEKTVEEIRVIAEDLVKAIHAKANATANANK